MDEFNREFGLDYWSNRVDDWDAFLISAAL
ncbi:MAG: hypothetical protein ACLRI8_10870 [Agathobacter rectalis]